MTSNSGHWTRDDLPSVIKWKSYAGMYLSRLRELEEYVDATLDHLNAHYPKPQSYDQGGVRGADSLLYRAERERDAAVARAEQMEKKLAKVMFDYQDVEDERDEWKARAEAAEARTAPAVTREDVRGVIDHWIVQGGNHEALLDDLWRWVSGGDPAVHVVRESDIAAVEVERGARNWIADGEAVSGVANGPDWVREPIDAYLSWVAQAEAVALAIEAEQAVDPVEAKARVEADRRYSGEPNHAFIEGAVWANRHVLGGKNAV